jgi:acetyl-CoA C-acetyltransferase
VLLPETNCGALAESNAQGAVIIAARRTPIAAAHQRLREVTVAELAATALRATADDAAALIGEADGAGDVVLGNCMGPGGNIARVAALAAGLGEQMTGMTIDRQCGSGLAAILVAAQSIVSGDSRLVFAGGAESASTAPLRISPGGAAYQRAPFSPAGFPDPEMGLAAEALAGLRHLSRARQDDYALRSHQLALAAADRGIFDAEIAPVAGLAHDDGPRAISRAVLARFGPAFAESGTVTAGNSCRISDGAAAVAVIPEHRRRGVPGLALRSSAVIGCDPGLPGLGPVPAVHAALARAGITLADVGAIEIVEAFAAQVLAVTDELGLGGAGVIDNRLCANGGALALGHPWGASGAVTVVRLFSRLVRAGAPAGTFGLAMVASGGGLGIAAVFEVVR